MKTFEFLKVLDKKEFFRFIEFVNSPFFNKRMDAASLMNILKENYPSFNLTEEEIYSRVYGKAKFNRQVTRNLVSRTQKLLDKFLAQLGMEKEKTFSDISFAYELARKGKPERVKKILNKGITELKSETYSVEYLKKLFEYLEAMNSLSVERENYKLKVEDSVLRGECAANYFLLSFLRIANEFAVFKHVSRYEENKELFNGFMNYFDFEKYLENLKSLNSEYYAITSIFYYGLLSKVNDPDGRNRDKLKALVFENLDSMKLKDQYTCWTMLFASYIFTDTVQKKPVHKELHKINKVFVQRNLLPRDEIGYIMGSNYHNIAMQAIISKDFDWAEEFLNNYKEQIEPGNRENMYCVLMASCLLGKKEYERCIDFLSRAKIDNIMTKIIIRSTYIKCYYELSYFDEAESAIEALRMFIYQNKELTPQIKRSLPDFIKYSRLLLKAKATNGKFPEEIYITAKNSGGFNSKSWVIEKMEELLK